MTVDTADVTVPDPEPELAEVAGLELVLVTAEVTVHDPEPELAGLELVLVAAAVVPVIAEVAEVTAEVAEVTAEVAEVTAEVAEVSGVEVDGVKVAACAWRDATQDRLRHEQLPYHGDRPDPARSARYRRPETRGHALFQADVALGHPEPDICDLPRMYCSATTVQ